MLTISAVLNRKGLWHCCNAVVVPVLLVAGSTIVAEAQTTVGGHIGFLLPLVTDTDGQVTNLASSFGIGFPVGITVSGTGRFAFDMEFVSFIQGSPRQVSLTLHPGGLWSLGHGFTFGMRVAFVVNSSEYGFTPLLHKSWPIKREGSFFKNYFVEADLPVRFNRPPGGPDTNPVQFAMHFGLGF
jgi:hypothetical protein